MKIIKLPIAGIVQRDTIFGYMVCDQPDIVGCSHRDWLINLSRSIADHQGSLVHARLKIDCITGRDTFQCIIQFTSIVHLNGFCLYQSKEQQNCPADCSDHSVDDDGFTKLSQCTSVVQQVFGFYYIYIHLKLMKQISLR